MLDYPPGTFYFSAMLLNLSIQNVVLIEACDIPLAPGLNVLTGETGAGKSILLDALGLVLGARTDTALLRAGAEQAVVTAEFDISKRADVHAALEPLGLEITDTLVLRRVMNAMGRTRAFAGDIPISVQALKNIGEMLIETHGQHEQRGLMDVATHGHVLDDFANLRDARGEVERLWIRLSAAQDALKRQQDAIESAAREEDYLRHVVAELRELGPVAGEETTLTDKRMRLQQGQKHAGALADIIQDIGGDAPVSMRLHAAQRRLARMEMPGMENVVDALSRAGDAVEDAVQQLERIIDECGHDPRALDALEDRLFSLRDAARKHRVSVDGLAEVLANAEATLNALDAGAHNLAQLEKDVAAARAEYIAAAKKLSDARRKQATRLEKAVATELAPLKMSGTELRVVVEELPPEKYGPRGVDSVRFEAATNKGSAFGSLHKIASGGELSRFMLAMKVVLAAGRDTGTLIFDEIDTGTGGAVADAIGARLAKLGEGQQVLVVTHLPQVAARGNHHLRVWKEAAKKQTFTHVEVVSGAERNEELARMLSGAEVTKEARAAAKKLMQG